MKKTGHYVLELEVYTLGAAHRHTPPHLLVELKHRSLAMIGLEPQARFLLEGSSCSSGSHQLQGRPTGDDDHQHRRRRHLHDKLICIFFSFQQNRFGTSKILCCTLCMQRRITKCCRCGGCEALAQMTAHHTLAEQTAGKGHQPGQKTRYKRTGSAGLNNCCQHTPNTSHQRFIFSYTTDIFELLYVKTEYYHSSSVNSS